MESPTLSTRYLKRSGDFVKLYPALLMFTYVISRATYGLRSINYRDPLAMMSRQMLMPLLAVFVMTIFGFYFTWKSYRNGEPFRKTRILYFGAHLLFFGSILSSVVRGFLLAV